MLVLHNTSRLLPRFLCLYDGRWRPARLVLALRTLLASLCAFALNTHLPPTWVPQLTWTWMSGASGLGNLTTPFVLAFLCAFALYACLHALAKFNRPTEHNARLQFLCIPGWERKLGKNNECLALKSKHQHLLLLFREMMLSMFRVARVGGKIVSALHVIVRGPNPLWTDHCLPLWTHYQQRLDQGN